MASDLTYQDFLDEFPEWDPATAAQQTEIQRALNRAERDVHRDTWGDDADYGVLYAAAHNLTIKGRTQKHGGAGAGGVTAKTVGDNVTGYASLARGGPNDLWTSTNYGAEFIRIRDGLDLTPMVAS